MAVSRGGQAVVRRRRRGVAGKADSRVRAAPRAACPPRTACPPRARATRPSQGPGSRARSRVRRAARPSAPAAGPAARSGARGCRLKRVRPPSGDTVTRTGRGRRWAPAGRRRQCAGVRRGGCTREEDSRNTSTYGLAGCACVGSHGGEDRPKKGMTLNRASTVRLWAEKRSNWFLCSAATSSAAYSPASGVSRSTSNTATPNGLFGGFTAEHPQASSVPVSPSSVPCRRAARSPQDPPPPRVPHPAERVGHRGSGQ